MSSTTPAAESSRRRRAPKPAAQPETATTEPIVERQSKPRPPRVETAPVPESAVGNTFVGRISDVVRVGFPKGRPAFGFINLGDNVEPTEAVPRIYFKKSDYNDAKHYFPRRGYQVTFVVNKNEEGRFYATDVQLTEAGLAEADAQKAKADEAKAAKAATTPAAATSTEVKGDGAKRERGPRTRKPKVEATLKLNVSIEGYEGVKVAEVKVGPLGLLKKQVIKLFDAAGEFVINHVSPTNPGGEFLTVAILRSLKDGDRLHFAKASPAATA